MFLYVQYFMKIVFMCQAAVNEQIYQKNVTVSGTTNYQVLVLAFFWNTHLFVNISNWMSTKQFFIVLFCL